MGSAGYPSIIEYKHVNEFIQEYNNNLISKSLYQCNLWSMYPLANLPWGIPAVGVQLYLNPISITETLIVWFLEGHALLSFLPEISFVVLTVWGKVHLVFMAVSYIFCFYGLLFESSNFKPAEISFILKTCALLIFS
jgi:hypothetical protein